MCYKPGQLYLPEQLAGIARVGIAPTEEETPDECTGTPARLPVRRYAAGTRPQAGSGAGRVLAAHAAAVRARPYQPVAARRRDRWRERVDDHRLRDRIGHDQGALGARVRYAARRPAGAARDCHALSSGPSGARALALRRRRARALARAALDDARRIHA